MKPTTLAKRRSAVFFDTVKKPQMKQGTVFHNQDTGEEWVLLEDTVDDCGKCRCIHTPDISRYKVGHEETFRIFYRNGGLAFHWKLGKNLNNR